MPPPVISPLAIDTLRHLRGGQRLGKQIEYFAEIDSTSSHAEQLARHGAAEGSAVIAEAQSRGRGRLGRSWSSPPNRNLYLSIVLRPAIPAEEAPKITLVAGLAAVEAVREWCPSAQIKWPNDILVDGRKVAGILAEMGMNGENLAHVILGIGVNLNIEIEEFPDELRDKAGSLATASGQSIDRVAFADRLLSHLQARYDEFLRQGFAPLRPAWEAVSCLGGRQVQIEDGANRIEGVVQGMNDDGTLRLCQADGTMRAVNAGEVTVVGGYSRAVAKG